MQLLRKRGKPLAYPRFIHLFFLFVLGVLLLAGLVLRVGIALLVVAAGRLSSLLDLHLVGAACCRDRSCLGNSLIGFLAKLFCDFFLDLLFLGSALFFGFRLFCLALLILFYDFFYGLAGSLCVLIRIYSFGFTLLFLF